MGRAVVPIRELNRRLPELGRFWAKVDKDGPGGCWLWTAGRTNGGYGMFGVEGNRTVPAHRYAYELLVGPIPGGLTIDHLCRVRHCVNPAHLEAVTYAENNRRSTSPSALNSLKTHCPQGHAYDEANTYVAPRGDRMCRECMRARTRRWRAERKAVA